jgi:kinesin family protein 2/24
MSNYSKGLPQNSIRYRTNKSPETRESKSKINKNNDKKLSVVEEMQQMKQRREDRKKRIEEEKQHKKDLLNDPNYIPKLDYDFEYLVNQKKSQIETTDPEPHSTSEGQKIYVCVRKRPIFDKEIQNGEIDCVTAINPKVCIYDCKLRIDGYTKYIDTNNFYFDNVFNEHENTNLLFECSVKPSLDILLKGGVVTCFAYGQTGSGKTYTMKGIQDAAIYNIFDNFLDLKKIMKKNFKFFISFFEIYSGRLYDLLNNRNKVQALEDKNQKVQIYGLTEKEVFNAKEMQEIVDFANAMRTTHNTVTNETSSRSHAICNFTIKIEGRRENEEYAKLSLVDLAGSERATETQSNDKSRLAEGAEINKSLLALKECIRALDSRKSKGNNDQHVPFRNSKLTLVLRDSFLGKADLCKIIMISCVSPSNHSSNHTINTLRYSDRLKEKTSSFGTPAITQVKKPPNLHNNNIVYKVVNSSSSKINNKLTNNKLGISVNNNGIKNNFGLANKTKDKEKEKEKEKQKRDNSETKNENIGKKINNFFDDIEELDEDNMQKLNLKPTPINEPIRKKTYVPKKKNRFALQKKTKTDRAENQQKSNNSNNNINKFKKKLNTENKKEIRDDELLKNKINEEDFDEPKQEKMLINQENEDHYKFKKRDIFKKNNNEKNEIEMENEFKNVEEEENIENREENENENEDFDENINNKNTMMETQTNIPYIIEEQENLISNHMDIIKSEAKLLTEEGNLISKIKGITEENYTMEEYVPKIEDIIETKLKYFKELKQKIKEYKSLLG